MAYTTRDESPGFYHVTCRGNNRRPIFAGRRDTADFLARLDRTAGRYGWLIWAYCLMPNHYHVVLEIGDAGMSCGWCELNTGYARAHNHRHGRANHLFGRRYWSRRIEGVEDMLGVCRYVLLNPCRAGLVADPIAWTPSSYRETIGLDRPIGALARLAVLDQFAPSPQRAAVLFRRFVRDPERAT